MNVPYWIRVPVGLENLVAKSFRDEVNAKIISKSHRSVVIDLPAKMDPLTATSANLIDDIFFFYGPVYGIDHTRQSIDNLVRWIEQNLIEPLQNSGAQYLRITTSFLGSRNYNRYFVEGAVQRLILSKMDILTRSNEHGDKWREGELRMRIHLEDDTALIGIALKDKPLHRREWRQNSYPGQLHPPIAAAMSSYIPKPVEYLIDPFSGSGTILIESYPYLKSEVPRIGFEVDEEAVKLASQNAEDSDTSIEFIQGKFIDQISHYDNFGILTNPPWGKKFKFAEIHESQFWQDFITIVRHASWAIILIPDPWEETLAGSGFKTKVLFTSRVRGSLVKGILIDHEV